MPLAGNVPDRIEELHHAQAEGIASKTRSDKQIVAIAFASRRREQRKSRKARGQ